MSDRNFEYTKISQLPMVDTLSEDASVFIVNAHGVTSTISLTNLITAITSGVVEQLNGLSGRVSDNENSIDSLDYTVKNIITAGFNLVGYEPAEGED